MTKYFWILQKLSFTFEVFPVLIQESLKIIFPVKTKILVLPEYFWSRVYNEESHR